ncbi:ferredoxin [Amycolatopsis ultiminotia]|uniref:Ferredoxin n=1 Tax=Amycolatopsis ultiminotia TaxID=543629 RepID=A0ABP6W6C8_9PSEU
MQVTIDEARCCGAGQCVLAAPEVFDQRAEDGVVVLLDATPPDGESAAVHEAVSLCPAAVIAVED